ncbi:MAG: aspartate kinase [Bdellovibrionaceae bacterium]|nr:aspartate kinase [Pseudobdellovibrionaceae bacterium]
MSSHLAPHLLVKKYGGTSVGSIERIEALADRLVRETQNGPPPIIVVSAMSGETNRLIALAEKIDPDYRGPAYDMLIASGEQVAISLLSMALKKRNINAQPMLGHQVGIRTDSTFAKARIQTIDVEPLIKLIANGIIPVVAGFQGVDADDNITTLGRGGSDTTAVALAAALKAHLKPQGGDCDCEIFTDVPAVFTADPRLVQKARELKTISSEEMMEMAALGSKVLHIRCVEIGAKHDVKIHLRSTFEERTGTWIVPGTAEQGPHNMQLNIEEPVVSAVTHDANTAVFTLFPVPAGPQFLASLFQNLAAKGVVVDIITSSETAEGTRLSFSVTKEDIPLSKQVLKTALTANIKTELAEGRAKISVVGVGMRNHPGVAARFFSVLATQNVSVQLVTTSEIKISAVIDGNDLERAAKALHTEFELDA